MGDIVRADTGSDDQERGRIISTYPDIVVGFPSGLDCIYEPDDLYLDVNGWAWLSYEETMEENGW